MNILVTGGAGFIGSHSVDLLISKGHNVIVLDNLATGLQKNVNKKAEFIHDDVLNIHKHKLKNIEVVLHLAAQVSVSVSLRNPSNDANINILGSLKLLDFCRKHKIKKFVFASTGGAMYGNLPKSKLPCTEKQNEIPESPYGIAKRAVEMYMDFYSKTYGMDCTSLRYANVYGPRQDYLGEAGVVAIFIGKILRDKNPVIFGDGLQTRDFVYVKDVAKANLNAINKKTSFKNINIGTGKQSTVNSLLSNIQKIMKNNSEPIHKNERKGEIRFSSLNNKLAKRELNWKPETSMERGLKETINWFSS